MIEELSEVVIWLLA